MAQPKTFTAQVWTIAGIITLIVLLVNILQMTFNVLLLILAATLLAVFFRRLAGRIRQWTGWSETLSLVLAIVSTLVFIGLFFWLAGATIQQQVAQLSKTLPQTVDQLRQQMGNSPLGQQVLGRLKSGSGPDPAKLVQTFFRSTFGVLGDLYVVLLVGIFFTASPKVYVNGFVKLLPPKAQPGGQRLLQAVGDTLGKWLKGQLLAMLIVAVSTAIGLLIIGVPMALVLALIAGLLNFIPNIGPLIAMVPAVLVALMQGPTTALLVVGLYLLVQALESNLITPQIQKRMINMPPALILIAQLFMGVLTGGWGLVLATPLTAILITVIGELKVKKEEGSEQ